jgi:hypothetical protein
MRSLSGCLLVATVALVWMASTAVGQTTVPMSFNGYYSAVSCAGPEGCVGAGLYGGTVNGVSVGPNNQVAGMVCDDYFDNITPGETWKANGVSAGSLTASNIGSLTLFGTKMGSAAIQDYTEIAYLISQMFFGNPTQGQQAAISEAIWYISSGGVSNSGALSSTEQGYLTAAVGAWANGQGINLGQYAGLYIYTPTPQAPGEAQEMWSTVPVPEGGTALGYLLLAGLCCFGAMFLRSRRQSGSISAA